MKLTSRTAFKAYFRFLLIVVLLLIPLKIWRAHLLRSAQVAYFPGEYSLLVKDIDKSQTNNGRTVLADLDPAKNPEQFCITKGYDASEALKSLITSEKRPIEFWSYRNPHLWMVGTVDRLNDLSFWNCVALLGVIYLVGLAYDVRLRYLDDAIESTRDVGIADPAELEHEKHQTETLSNLNIVAVLVLWLIYGGIPLIVHRQWDNGPIHGAFWTDQECVPGVWLTQCIDAIFFTLVSGAGAVTLVAAFRLWRTYHGKPITKIAHRLVRSLEKLLNAFFVCPFLIVAAFGTPMIINQSFLEIQQMDSWVFIFFYWGVLFLLFIKTLHWIARENTMAKDPKLEVEWAKGFDSILYVKLKPNYLDPD